MKWLLTVLIAWAGISIAWLISWGVELAERAARIRLWKKDYFKLEQQAIDMGYAEGTPGMTDFKMLRNQEDDGRISKETMLTALKLYEKGAKANSLQIEDKE